MGSPLQLAYQWIRLWIANLETVGSIPLPVVNILSNMTYDTCNAELSKQTLSRNADDYNWQLGVPRIS